MSSEIEKFLEGRKQELIDLAIGDSLEPDAIQARVMVVMNWGRLTAEEQKKGLLVFHRMADRIYRDISKKDRYSRFDRLLAYVGCKSIDEFRSGDLGSILATYFHALNSDYNKFCIV